MAVKQINSFLASQTVVTTAETVVGTSGSYTYDNPNPFVGGEHAGTGQGVSISGIINIVAGTGATQVTVRVRYGGLTGAIVGGAAASIVQNVTAAQSFEIAYEAEDLTRAAAGGQIYVVTVQQTAATGNATVQPVTMDVQGA